MVARKCAQSLVMVAVVALAACSSASSSPTPVHESPVAAAPGVVPASIALPAPTPTQVPTPVIPTATPSPSLDICASPCSVALLERAYQPSIVTVKVGSEVIWTNRSCPGCTVTFTALGVNSGPTAIGDTFKHTFSVAGEYIFHCLLDPQEMTGMIEVTK
jgi:hypothetical protein